MDARATILELNAQWGRMIETQDLDAIVGLYRADACFFVPGQPTFEGHDAIRSAWQFLFGLPEFGLSLNATSVEVSGDESLAMNRGTYRLSYTGPNGPVVEIGKYLLVWRAASPGAWQVVADMFNSDAPA